MEKCCMRRNSSSEGRRWLSQAQKDLFWAGHLTDQGGYHLACFLSQQVAEKALKAFLYAQGEEIVLGHSVERLCHAAGEYEPQFLEKVRTWSLLDGFYIPTRYPNGLPDGIPADVYTQEAAQQAVRMADEVVQWVANLISSSGQKLQ